MFSNYSHLDARRSKQNSFLGPLTAKLVGVGGEEGFPSMTVQAGNLEHCLTHYSSNFMLCYGQMVHPLKINCFF
jgi:hypothetical protein